MWSWLSDRGTELFREFFRRGGALCGNTKPFGDRDEADDRMRQIEQGLCLWTGCGGADARQLELQDRVCVVVEDDDGDVQLFAGHGPQRRDRVQPASVGLQRND